jgi:uncharacterized protein YbaR (Trm112 family)
LKDPKGLDSKPRKDDTAVELQGRIGGLQCAARAGLVDSRAALRVDAPVMSGIDKDLLDMMVCPITHAPVVQSGDWIYSTDEETRYKYPIRDGIPIMLIDEKQVADPDEFRRVMAEAAEKAKQQQKD